MYLSKILQRSKKKNSNTYLTLQKHGIFPRMYLPEENATSTVYQAKYLYTFCSGSHDFKNPDSNTEAQYHMRFFCCEVLYVYLLGVYKWYMNQ